MKTSVAILSVSVASAMAGPFSMSTKQCNVAPSAAANGKVRPYHNGKADTAVDCQTYCASDDSCKSFAFGLVKGAHHASCLLFEEPAAKVPARKDGLHVFDKECAADRVPTSAPTTAQPWGTVPKKVLVRRATQCNCAASGSANNDVQPFKTTTAATAKDCQALAAADSSCMSFLYGLSDDYKSPICKLYKVAASKIPARSDKLFVFDKGCSSKQVPTTAPTKDAPRGLVSGSSKVTLVTEIDINNQSQDTKTKDTKAKDTKAKDTKSEDTKTDEQEIERKDAGKAKATKVQKSQPKVTKVAKVEGKKAQYAEPQVTEHAEKPKTKCTTNLNAKPKATKTAKVQQEKVQYAEPTKVSSPKTKVVTKVTEVDNNDDAQNTKAKDTKSQDTDSKTTEYETTEYKSTDSKSTEYKSTESKGTEVSDTKAKAENNKQVKATKVQHQQYQATIVAEVETNKNTKSTKDSEAQGSNNKEAKVESPKTLVTKVRNNGQQATQAAKADGKKSECKTTKASNNQPKATQAY